MALRALGHGRRPSSDLLRAGGVSGEEPAIPTAGEPGDQVLEGRRQSARAARRPEVPLRSHNVPSDRALPRGRHEPVESPVKNQLYQQQASPVIKYWKDGANPLAQPGDPKFPYALTTYRSE